MTASNIPRHGEGIIEAIPSVLGEIRYVASFQFQQFLDSLGGAQDSSTVNTQDIDQLLQITNSKSNGKITLNASKIIDLSQLISRLSGEINRLRGKLNKETVDREDLEQFVYGN